MADDKDSTVLAQFSYRRIHPRSRIYGNTGVRAACAANPSVRTSLFSTKWVEALPGCCMFATGIITESSENRICELTDHFCPASDFTNPQIFRNCPSRAAEKEKEHQ